MWLTGLGSGAACAAPAEEIKDQGKALLTRMCGNCHAVGPTGNSPRRGAPAFRTNGERYNISELTDRMTEQLISIHPDMPDFRFTEREAKAIRTYLYSIQPSSLYAKSGLGSGADERRKWLSQWKNLLTARDEILVQWRWQQVFGVVRRARNPFTDSSGG